MLRLLQLLIMVAVLASLVAIPASAEPTTATCYGPGYEGNFTTSGDIFNSSALTAAHPYLPFGTQLLINHDGASVPVTINDRGPILDLTMGACGTIGLLDEGIDAVDMQVL